MARPTVRLDALGEPLLRDLDDPDRRAAGFASRDAYARVAPAEVQSPKRRAWVVGYSPGVATIGVGTATELLMQALAHVADHGGGDVTLWRAGAVPDDDRAASGAGLDIDRELFQMRVPLPLATLPPATLDDPDRHDGSDVTLRDFRTGDAAAVLAVNNAAFAGHAEQGNWTETLFAARRREPWFDPHWLLVAERDGDVVGFNWLRRHPATHRDPEMGEIYVIGVAPHAHGEGIGRMLVRAGLARIVESGVHTALLYVAADNAAAIALYQSLGFTVTRVDRAYRAEVLPA
jgi:mycothiol synthase